MEEYKQKYGKEGKEGGQGKKHSRSRFKLSRLFRNGSAAAGVTAASCNVTANYHGRCFRISFPLFVYLKPSHVSELILISPDHVTMYHSSLTKNASRITH